MIVEALRLLVTLLLTALGYSLGGRINPSIEVDPGTVRLVSALIGAGVGYVGGGLFGRGFRQRLDVLPQRFLPQADGQELFAGAFGLIVGVVLGGALSAPIIALIPGTIAWPLAGLIVLSLALVGARLFAMRSHDLLTVAGLRPRAPLVARRIGQEEPSYVVDSSAAIDGRILELARMGLIEGRVWLPGFVIDEMQGLADSGEKSRRRRGRRGLEILDALRSTAHVEVVVLDDEIPEVEDVDAKLIIVAERSGAQLLTTDTHLAKAAELRGIRVLNPAGLGEKLKVAVAVGEIVTVPVSKTGSGEGQGVGYLDDGTMVVIDGASERIGEEIEVEVTATTRTAIGRMLFGRPA